MFYDRCERKVFAEVAAGAWLTTDRFRHAVELIDLEAYLTHDHSH